jgi:hypothetical protein
MSDDPPVRAYCVTCRAWHYFGFDGVGAPLQLLTCRRGEPPQTKGVPIP